MDNGTFTEITTDTCDSCGSRGPTSLHHNLGAPVLGVCRSCDPVAFEAQARRDIDDWLAGGNESAFGRGARG
jgi:hypothetical protein